MALSKKHKEYNLNTKVLSKFTKSKMDDAWFRRNEKMLRKFRKKRPGAIKNRNQVIKELKEYM